MARYIDADKLKMDSDIDNFDMPYGCSFKAIDRQPTADVEVVRHGYWKPTKIPAYFGGVIYECSVCGAIDGDHTQILGRYCWRCGAKMDGGKDE